MVFCDVSVMCAEDSSDQEGNLNEAETELYTNAHKPDV